MPFETAKNKLTGKLLVTEAREMRDAQMVPIVLRWRMALPTTQNLYGLSGAKTSTAENLKGEIEISGTISSENVVTFFPDEFRVGYALVPKDPRNLECLAAAMLDNPPWVIEGPADVVEEIKALADEMEANHPKKGAKSGKSLKDLT